MLCDNCGKNEANIKFTQIINNKKTEMMICEECGKKLGITNMNFEMPIGISDFLGELTELEDSSSFMPFSLNTNEIKCDSCGMIYEEFLDRGKFGCENCYKAFQSKIDILLRRIQGTEKYIGRKAKHNNENIVEKEKTNSELEKLQNKLKKAIKEERYEDCAKIRDEIKKLE